MSFDEIVRSIELHLLYEAPEIRTVERRKALAWELAVIVWEVQ